MTYRSDLVTVSDILGHVNNLFNVNGVQNRASQYIPVNVQEDKDAWYLNASMPGWNREDIKVSLDKDVLSIVAEKTVSQEKTEDKPEENVKRMLSQEWFALKSARNFKLNNQVDQEKVKVEFKDGVLNIVLPKKEIAKTVKTLEIE